MELHLIILRGKVRTIEDAYAHRSNFSVAMDPSELGALLNAYCDLSQFVASMIKQAREACKGMKRMHNFGNDVRKELSTAVQLGYYLQTHVQVATEEGGMVECNDRFQAAFDSLKATKEDFFEKWPSFTYEDLERSEEDIRQGRFVSIEEAYQDALKVK